jgi:hypothetical protein
LGKSGDCSIQGSMSVRKTTGGSRPSMETRLGET